jgi:hypothetical protein
VQQDKRYLDWIVERENLQRLWQAFPDDVLEAFADAHSATSQLVRPVDPKAEPWPPMRAGTGR